MVALSLLTMHLQTASRIAPTAFEVARPALRAPHPALALSRRSTAPSLVMTFAEVPSFTQVPKAKTEEEAITGALALAHDCQAAYGEAAKKAEDAELKKNLEKFAGQASSQIDQWRGLLSSPPEKETGISSDANAGKVKLAQFVGDKAIATAIFNNSNDSFTAFSGIAERSEFSDKTKKLASKLIPEAKSQRTFLEEWLSKH